MEELQTASTTENKSQKKTFLNRRLKIILLIFSLIFLSASTASAYYYYHKIYPLQVLKNALSEPVERKTFKDISLPLFNALQFIFKNNQENNNITMQLIQQYKPNPLTRVNFAFDNIQAIPQNHIKAEVLITNNLSYINASHIESYKFTEPFHQYFPEVLATESFTLLQPILTGFKDLEIETVLVKGLCSKITPPLILKLSQKENKNVILEALAKAVVVKDYKTNLVCEDSKCDRIIIALNKEKLVKVSDYLSTNASLTSSEIETIRILANAVAQQGSAEVLVDKKRNLIKEYSLILSPISKYDMLQILKLMQNNASEEAIYMLNSIYSQVEKMPEGKRLSPQMTIQMKQYQQDPLIETKPSRETVKFSKIKAAIDKELLPTFLDHPELDRFPLAKQVIHWLLF